MELYLTSPYVFTAQCLIKHTQKISLRFFPPYPFTKEEEGVFGNIVWVFGNIVWVFGNIVWVCGNIVWVFGNIV